MTSDTATCGGIMCAHPDCSDCYPTPDPHCLIRTYVVAPRWSDGLRNERWCDCVACRTALVKLSGKSPTVAVTDERSPRRPSLPDDASKRLEYPMADGLLDYFPNALAEVARLSHVATQQHHPDKGMHWDRSKSTDHRNKIMRHLIDTGLTDDKGMRHSAMVAWRALALLQVELEEAEGLPPSRASRNTPAQ